MRAQRKIRSDAGLMNLPEARQQQIIEWCDTPKSEDCVGGYAFARQQLAEDGLVVSERALSAFWSWFYLQQDLSLARSMEEVVEADPESVARARRRAQKLLLDLSIARQDAKLFSAATNDANTVRHLDLQEASAKTKAKQKDRALDQKDTDLALANRRVALLETNAAKAKEKLTAIVAKGGLSPEALKQIEQAAKILQ